MIESLTDSIEPLMQIYRVIYSVHMPLFLFLSGLFQKSRMIGEQWSFTTPVWHLWYFFSLGTMAGIRMDWKRCHIRLAGITGLAAYLFLYIGMERIIPTELFYQADSYGTLGIEQGPFLQWS